MKVIAVVDDERDITDLVAFHLEKEGFSVRKFFNGGAFIKSLMQEAYDCIVLDLMLPDIDGISITKFLKANEKTANIPLIMLTAKGSEEDIVLGLEAGADNYVTKPFSPRVLTAKVKVLTRGRKNEKIIRRDKLSIDTEKHKVNCGTKAIVLTATEFRMLEILAENEEKLFTRGDLLNRVWGYSASPTHRAVDVHIKHIREKLGGCGCYLKTIRGIGYKFSLEK